MKQLLSKYKGLLGYFQVKRLLIQLIKLIHTIYLNAVFPSAYLA